MVKLVVWANQADATQFAQIAPLVINHVKQDTPLALALIQQAALDIDKIGSAPKANSVNKTLPCSGISAFIEPWLGAQLRARLVPRRNDASIGAVLMIRNAAREERASQ